MRALFFPALLAIVMTGCAQRPQVATMPPLYTPCALIASSSTHARPMDVLPASDAEDFFIPRDEKVALGSLPLSGVSAFTIYTYDAQRLTDRNGNYGYRSRWVIQSGFSGTLPP